MNESMMTRKNSDYLLKVIIGRENEGAFWDTGNVLYLAKDDNSECVHI